jgi:uncharacterized protein (UPF0303 family)
MAMSVNEDLAAIARQEARLQFPAFDETLAWAVGCRLREMALVRKAPLVIDVRRFGHQLFFCALAGSTPDNAEWARRKSNVVARFHRSSYGMGLELQQKNTTLPDRFGLFLADFAAHGGSFPVALAGSGVIGSITISGLPQRVDHELVVEAICGQLSCDYSELRLAPESRD